MKDRFTGFRLPNYTQVPDELFDKLLPDLVESELKVLRYIVRRTLGFKKRLDAISLKQLEKGIPGRDRGVGIGRRQIIRCLKCLEEKRIIRIIRQKDPKNINEINFYSLNFSEENGGSDSQDTTVDGKLRVTSLSEYVKVFDENNHQLDTGSVVTAKNGLHVFRVQCFTRANPPLAYESNIIFQYQSAASVVPVEIKEPPSVI